MPEHLVFEFESEEALLHFKSWLCGSGEQDYWQWMECREGEEEGNITALKIDYHGDIRNIDGFNQCRVLKTECGRMDAGWRKVEVPDT
jgi:hypothetical protein